MNNRYSKAFTFIELLVVITIISLLTAIGAVSYSQFLKQSRDGKRKADIEQIRAAVEMYRSNNGSYPLTANFSFGNCTDPGGLTDGGGIIYLTKASNDPKCSSGTPAYSYTSTGSTYIVGAYLEITPASPPSCGTCGTGYNCNYCVTPYGQQ